MTGYRVQQAASVRIDEIYAYTYNQWGAEHADAYISGLLEVFERIARGDLVSRPVPAEFEVDGYFVRYERHYIYWKPLENGDIGIVTVLHERMHQIDRFRDDCAEPISPEK